MTVLCTLSPTANTAFATISLPMIDFKPMGIHTHMFTSNRPLRHKIDPMRSLDYPANKRSNQHFSPDYRSSFFDPHQRVNCCFSCIEQSICSFRAAGICHPAFFLFMLVFNHRFSVLTTTHRHLSVEYSLIFLFSSVVSFKILVVAGFLIVLTAC